MKATIPVAAYLRMSSDKQDKSIEEQRTEVAAYAAKRGYRIVKWYIDEGISGWKSKQRLEFQNLITDAEKELFKAVLCWDQSRFSRFDPMEANYYWHRLRVAGVTLETVKEGPIDWNSLGGWLTASVNQHGKAEYVKSLAHDSVRGRRAAVVARKWLTISPYGYKKQSGTLVLGDATEVATVRRIFEMRAEGMGMPSIAAVLNAENIPSPRGCCWYARQVRKMLENESYRGNQVIGRYSRAKFCRITDKEFTNAGTHPAIIDEALWERVQRVNRRRTNNHSSRSGKKPGGPLSSLLVCKKCGAKMLYEKRYDRYICQTNYTGQGCTNNSILNKLAMKLVVNKIRDLILMGSRKALAEHIAHLRGPGRRKTVQADVAKQLAEIDRKIASAAERLLDVEPDLVPAVQEAMRKLKEKREAIAEQVKAAKVERSGRSPEAIAAQIWELDHVLQHGDLLTVRAALAQVIDRVELAFEQSKVDRRKWFPVGGTVFFFNYGPLNHHLEGNPTVSSRKKATLRRKDFEE